MQLRPFEHRENHAYAGGVSQWVVARADLGLVAVSEQAQGSTLAPGSQSFATHLRRVPEGKSAAESAARRRQASLGRHRSAGSRGEMYKMLKTQTL